MGELVRKPEHFPVSPRPTTTRILSYPQRSSDSTSQHCLCKSAGSHPSNSAASSGTGRREGLGVHCSGLEPTSAPIPSGSDAGQVTCLFPTSLSSPVKRGCEYSLPLRGVANITKRKVLYIFGGGHQLVLHSPKTHRINKLFLSKHFSRPQCRSFKHFPLAKFKKPRTGFVGGGASAFLVWNTKMS